MQPPSVPPPDAPHPRIGPGQQLLLYLSLALLALFVYLPSLHHGFINLDDPGYVTQNLHVRGGVTWPGMKWAFSTTSMGNWHPLTWLSHMADVQFFGLDASAHHLINLLLHLCNVLLLFAALRSYTGRVGPSFAVAALFAVHPLNVESVAWIAERKNVLSTLFFLLALAAYRNYVRRPEGSRYAALVVCFVLGLMSKPSVVVLPVCLLLLDYWPLQRFVLVRGQTNLAQVWPCLREKVPLFALSAASAAVTYYSARADSSVMPLAVYSLAFRLQNAALSYCMYLYKAFWPVRLAVFYPHPAAIPVWQTAVAFALLTSITALIYVNRQKKYLVMGWLWFLLTLAPAIGLIQAGTQARADRYAYLSFLGIFIAVVWGMADWAESRRLSRFWLPAAAAVVLAALAWDTSLQLRYWQDSVTLFSRALQVTTNNYLAEDSLGEALASQGNSAAALPHFVNALRINPVDALAHNNLGTYFLETGQPQAAIAQYAQVLQLTGNSLVRAAALNNSGAGYAAMQQFNLARVSYQQAAQTEADDYTAYLGLGMLDLRQQKFAAAEQNFRRSLAILPTVTGYARLGDALQAQNHLPDALQAYLSASRISPGLPEVTTRIEELKLRMGSKK